MPTSSSKTDKQPAKCYDIVIVGGGIAGLYCCYELLKKSRSGTLNTDSMLLLEASNRFGGRIETWSLLRSDEQNGKAIGFEDTWDPAAGISRKRNAIRWRRRGTRNHPF